MRKLALTAVLATSALATPAMARDGAWYLGLEFGPMLVENMEFDVNGVDNVVTGRHRAGFDGDGVIGYDFGGFRLEAEVGYRQANVRGVSTFAPITVGGANFPANNYSSGGRNSALSFMVNGLIDFGPDDGIQGFVGAGAGVARVKSNPTFLVPGFLNDSDTNFAWQALAGVRAPIGPNMDVSFKYRFFNADNVDVTLLNGASARTRFRSHSLLGGVIFNFGAPAPAPVVETPAPVVTPPPAEPTPPPPAAKVCAPGPYIVFFEWDKSDITGEAASILDNAVTAYGDCGQAQVMLAGHTDTSGTPKYNLGLSQRRADAVSAYMTSRGVPSGVISTKAFGESSLRVQTADGVREVQNRRVEITYGPGSGM